MFAPRASTRRATSMERVCLYVRMGDATGEDGGGGRGMVMGCRPIYPYMKGETREGRCSHTSTTTTRRRRRRTRRRR